MGAHQPDTFGEFLVSRNDGAGGLSSLQQFQADSTWDPSGSSCKCRPDLWGYASSTLPV